MAGLLKDDDDLISDINVTPFVDVVLVLLIIFMVTSSYIAKAAIEVDLPKAASSGQAVETTLNIVITRDGEILLNGETVQETAISEFIKNEKNPKLQAVIAADKGVPYGKVMRIIDVVKLNGVNSFALNVEREPISPEK